MPSDEGGHRGDVDLEFTLAREVHEESESPAKVHVASHKLLAEETAEETETAFVQVVFLGVPMDISPTVRKTVEGKALPIRFDQLRDYLLGHHPWGPSGKMHVLAWLALGAPGCPRATFSGLRPIELFREVMAAQWEPHQPAKVRT